VNGWVDRHESSQRRDAADITNRAKCITLRNIGEEGTDSACRSNKTGNVPVTNTVVLSRKHCCCGKAISITYS
jgi:hypothetical protein